MSAADGLCNYCKQPAGENATKFVWDDVIACSKRCDDALSALLDGCSEEEVAESWRNGK